MRGAWGLGFKVEGLDWFRVEGLGFSVQVVVEGVGGLRFGIPGLRFRV